MARKKTKAAGEPIPLKLTAAERTLVLELLCLEKRFEQIIEKTPADQPVMLKLDDLEDFGDFLAAEANHCESESCSRKLDKICAKIDKLLVKANDGPPQKATWSKVSLTTPNLPTRQTKFKTANTTGKLFQFKITLLGTKPAIWRRIQVQDCTLDKLHEHIQTAMGWTNSHLHQFEIKGKCYADPELLDDGFDDFECIDSTKTKLSQILPKTGKRFAFRYEYDFGDSWYHEILFEGSPSPDPKAKYPLCLEGERSCPPEDCGGVGGYEEFLKVIRNPKHKEHKSMLEWVGGAFDPEEFEPAKATKAMKKGLPDWRS